MLLYLIIVLCLILFISSWRQNKRIQHEVMNDVSKFDRIFSSDLINLACSSAVLLSLILFLHSFGNSDLDDYENTLSSNHESHQIDEYKRLLKSVNSIDDQTKVLIINGSKESVNLDILKAIFLEDYDLACDIHHFTYKPEAMRLSAEFIEKKFEFYDLIISFNDIEKAYYDKDEDELAKSLKNKKSLVLINTDIYKIASPIKKGLVKACLYQSSYPNKANEEPQRADSILINAENIDEVINARSELFYK